MCKGGNKLQVWIKLQRKIKSVNTRIEAATCQKTRSRLLRKLKMLVSRLFTLNRKWRIGIATAAIFMWLGNNNVQAQYINDDINSNGLNGFQMFANGGPGYDISNAGDFNGDGIDDVIVSNLYNPIINKKNKAYVIYGTTNGYPSLLHLDELNGTNGFILIDSVYIHAGKSVSGAGDFNGDNYDDLIISAAGSSDEGGICILYGNNNAQDSVVYLNSLDATKGFRIVSDSVRYIGTQVTGMADMNNDGFDDIAFSYLNSIEKEPKPEGRVYLMYGNNTITNPELNLDTLLNQGLGSCIFSEGNGYNEKSFGGEEHNNALTFGDINGDGYDDLVIGEGKKNVVHVVFGSYQELPDIFDVNTLDGLNGFQLKETTDNYLGTSVETGDINGDGFDDIVAGNYYYAGRTTVLFGKANAFNAIESSETLNGNDGFIITGFPTHEGDYSYTTVSTIDDMNGDGFDEILIGCDDAPYTTFSGRVYMVYGKNEGWPAVFDINTLDGTNGFSIIETGNSAGFGRVVFGIGDLNNDGKGDFAARGPGAGPFIFFGKDKAIEQIAFNDLDSSKGFEVIGKEMLHWNGDQTIGDFNGDGMDDVIFTSVNENPFVIFGTDSPDSISIELNDLDGTNGFNLMTIEEDYNTAMVDINADGFDDIVIGQPYAGLNDEGRNFVLFGHNGAQDALVDIDNPGTNSFMIINSSEADYMTGYQLFNGGDINGDGFDDLYTSNYYSGYYGSVIFANGTQPDTIDLSTDMDASMGFVINNPTIQVYKGDFNGDVKNDIMTKSSAYHKVLFGQATGVIDSIGFTGNPDPYDGTNGFKISTWANTDEQKLVDGILDFNNDGYDDVLIRKAKVGLPNYGNDSLFVVYGKVNPVSNVMIDGNQSAINGSDAMSIGGLPTGDILNSVTTLDFNNDGFDDFVLSTKTNNEIYLVYGNNDGEATTDLSNLQVSQGFKINGFNDNALAVHKAGDLNSDGFDDIIIMDSIKVDVTDKVVGHIIYGQNATNTLYSVSELQIVGGYDLVFEERINYVNHDKNINPYLRVENPDFNGDGYEDAVLAIHNSGVNSSFKFLLSKVSCSTIITSEDVSICSGEDYTYPDGATVTNIIANTSHISNLVSQATGCDSTVTTNISLNEIYSITEEIDVCAGEDYTFPDGSTITNITSGINYQSLLASIQGCDSTVTTNISVKSIDVTVKIEGTTLTANEVDADGYQWINCDLDNSPIDGETNKTYTASSSGNYAVIIEDNNCVESSACNSIVILGMEDEKSLVQSIWPNPTSEEINIQLWENNDPVEIIISDNSGKIVSSTVHSINLSLLSTNISGSSGVYYVRVKSGLKTATFKIIKK